MTRKIGVVIFIFFIFTVFAALVFFLLRNQNHAQNYVSYFNIKAFGNLSRGDPMISGPGDYTLAPYLKIPKSKFYVTVIQDDYRCINKDCDLDEAIIQTMGGWLQMETIKGYPDIEDEIGFDFSADENIKSLVLIGDENGKISGIYLNKNSKDILAILKNHPDLADFDLLHGANEFKKLKVGDLSPLKPGDQISQMSDELQKASLSRVPKDRKFYLYSLEKRKYDVVGQYLNEPRDNIYICSLFGGCRYSEPDPPHDFLFAEIEDLGGWFLANDNDNSKMIEMFGLNPQEVFSGKFSLVVLTDTKGIIVALHPNKRMSDALTILSQHPDLVDVQSLYK